jgi:hypothetical protein
MCLCLIQYAATSEHLYHNAVSLLGIIYKNEYIYILPSSMIVALRSCTDATKPRPFNEQCMCKSRKHACVAASGTRLADSLNTLSDTTALHGCAAMPLGQ